MVTSAVGKKCGRCAERSRPEALDCRHCGHTFTEAENEAYLAEVEGRKAGWKEAGEIWREGNRASNKVLMYCGFAMAIIIIVGLIIGPDRG